MSGAAAERSLVSRVSSAIIWIAISIVGAGAVGAIALKRNEPINAMWLIVAAVCVYAIGYRF